MGMRRCLKVLPGSPQPVCLDIKMINMDAGYEEQKQQIEDTLLLALQHPEVYEAIAAGTRLRPGSNRPRAVLFEGPPGCGKTTSARSVAPLPVAPTPWDSEITSPSHLLSDTGLARRVCIDQRTALNSLGNRCRLQNSVTKTVTKPPGCWGHVQCRQDTGEACGGCIHWPSPDTGCPLSPVGLYSFASRSFNAQAFVCVGYNHCICFDQSSP